MSRDIPSKNGCTSARGLSSSRITATLSRNRAANAHGRSCSPCSLGRRATWCSRIGRPTSAKRSLSSRRRPSSSSRPLAPSRTKRSWVAFSELRKASLPARRRQSFRSSKCAYLPAESSVLTFARQRKQFQRWDLPRVSGELPLMRALNTLVSVGLLEIREKVELPEPEPPPMTESPPVQEPAPSFAPVVPSTPEPAAPMSPATPPPWSPDPVPETHTPASEAPAPWLVVPPNEKSSRFNIKNNTRSPKPTRPRRKHRRRLPSSRKRRQCRRRSLQRQLRQKHRRRGVPPLSSSRKRRQRRRRSFQRPLRQKRRAMSRSYSMTMRTGVHWRPASTVRHRRTPCRLRVRRNRRRHPIRPHRTIPTSIPSSQR